VQTGLDLSAVPDAIASGLLSGIEIDERLRVSVSSVEHFNAKYVPLSQLSGQLKTTTRRLLRICRSNGLHEISLRRTGSVAVQPALPRNATARLTECWEAELRRAFHLAKNRLDFFNREDHWNPVMTLDSLQSLDLTERLLQDVFVQEYDGVERLRLG